MLEKDSTCMHALDVMMAAMHLWRLEIWKNVTYLVVSIAVTVTI